MSVIPSNVETAVVDYSLADITSGEPPADADSHAFVARIGSTTIRVRDLADDFTEEFELQNETATKRIELLTETGQLSRMVLVRAPNIVWALWDTVNDDVYPVTSRPRFVSVDRYDKNEFFERLGRQARRIAAMLTEAKRDGGIELIGN